MAATLAGRGLKDSQPLAVASQLSQRKPDSRWLLATMVDWHTITGNMIPVSYTHLTLPTIPLV